MDVKEAVAVAKRHFKEVFADETGGPPTLEEVWFDDSSNVWCITLGIRRNEPASFRDIMNGPGANVHYKTVRVSDIDGKPISIRNRDPLAA